MVVGILREEADTGICQRLGHGTQLAGGALLQLLDQRALHGNNADASGLRDLLCCRTVAEQEMRCGTAPLREDATTFKG